MQRKWLVSNNAGLMRHHRDISLPRFAEAP